MIASLGNGAIVGFAAAAATASHGRALPILPAQEIWPPPLAPAPVKEDLFDVGGVKLFYWDSGGTGEPVMLLHPLTGSAAIWRYQQPALVAAGYRVVAYSRRGHLRSEAGSAADPGFAVDDLIAVARGLRLGCFHLVGSAAGGFIVPDMALSYPEALRSITIASSLGGVTDPDYAQTSRALQPDGFQKFPASFRELGPSYRAANGAGVAQWEALEHDAVHTPIRQKPRNDLTWPAIERIRTPTLVMTGDCDLYMPPPRLTVLAGHLANVTMATIAEAGHSAYWEQPAAFNRQLIAFLRSTQR